MLLEGKTHTNGIGNYRYIEKLLRERGDIYIVSPYIDPYYASVIRRHASGKRFYIISSSMDSKAAMILESRGSPASVALFVIAVILILAAMYVYSILSIGALLLASIAIGARLLVFKRFSRNKV
ncbi:MAG: hypothetical protein QXF01_01625, partial [Candidatus Micrarchaeaceae archaeon]